jgi:TolA-binding protein
MTIYTWAVNRSACLVLAILSIIPMPAWAQDDPALDQYFIANAAYNRKLYPVAVSQFQEFLQKHATHPKADLARRGLGLSQYALKQYEKAIPHFAALLAKPGLDKTIDREHIIMLQGQCMLHSTKKDEASQLFITQLSKLKKPAFRTAALAAICDIAFGKSEWTKVTEWSAKLLATNPQPDQAARGLYQRGFSFYQIANTGTLPSPDKEKKTGEAITALAKVAPLNANPAWTTRADYLLGECHTSLKQFDKAEPAFASALPGMKGPEAADCQYRLGITRFLLKKFEQSALDLEAYLKQAKPDAKGKPAPYVNDAKFYIGRSLLEGEDFNKADKQFSQLAPGKDLVAAKANLWWARVHSHRDNFDRAAQILAEAIKRKEFTKLEIIDDLDFDLANALMSKKEPDWKTASATLGRVEGRGKFGQMAEVIAQNATCLHKLKDFNGSLQAADRFIAKFADHELAGDARFIRAENMFLLNRGDEATKAYAQFINAHKEHANVPAAQLRIAQVHHLAGRWPQALASAGPLLAKKPGGRLFAQLSFVVGDCLFRQEKWQDCIKPLEEFVAVRVKIEGKQNNKRKVTIEPNLDTALMQLAVAHDRNEQKEKALDHLLTLVSHYGAPTPHLPLALTEQGRLAYESGDLKLARSALENFIRQDEAAKKGKNLFKEGAPAQRPRVMYHLGWIEATEEKHEAAAERFSKVPNTHPLGADAALQHGIALVNHGNFEVAAKHFPQMLNQFKDHEKLNLIIYYAGLSAAKQEDWKNAAAHFKRFTTSYPKSENNDQALYEWAWAERGLKRDKEAVGLYEQILAKYPKSPLVIKVQSELAELNLDSGAQDKVIAQLTEIMKTLKDETLKEPIRIQLASAHFKKGDYEISAVMFEKLITDYPKSKLSASMLFQAGESRLRLKETVAARDHFAKAVKLSGLEPALAETLTMRLGETQALTDQHKQAVGTYQQFLNSFRESKWLRNAQFGLGYALERIDKPQDAVNEYNKLFADPKLVDLWTVRGRFQTGECYFNMQQYEQAIATFVKVEINFKTYPSWQAKSVLEIGRILLAQGKRDDAALRFKDVINRYSKEKAAIVARQYLDELRSG